MKQKLLDLWASFKTNTLILLDGIWNYLKNLSYPIAFLGLASVVIYGIIEYRDILISLLNKSIKSEVNSTNAQDAALKIKEDEHNQAADALVQKASEESTQDTSVAVDWNIDEKQ